MCGRFIADQNKVLLIQESGTYSTTTGLGQWIGQVTGHDVTDTENVLITRYLGTGSRSFDTTDLGPRDVTGTLTYHPQDMRVFFLGLGSVRDISGTNSEHSVTEINTDVTQNPFVGDTLDPPFAFTLEDSKQAVGAGNNFVRTINGVVPITASLTLTQGEKATVEIGYIGQTLAFTSGATTAVTENTDISYLWSHATIQDRQGGATAITLSTLKEFVFEYNQNIEGPHYLNGSRDISVPFPANRDYTITLSMDADSVDANRYYDNFYKTGSIFRMTLAMDTVKTGSQEAFFTFSGCIVTEADIPTPLEGMNEATFTIRPQSVNGSSIDSNAGNFEYNPY